MTAPELRAAMQQAGLLEDPAPPAAERWIETFLEAFGTGFDAGEALRRSHCCEPSRR